MNESSLISNLLVRENPVSIRLCSSIYYSVTNFNNIEYAENVSKNRTNKRILFEWCWLASTTASKEAAI